MALCAVEDSERSAGETTIVLVAAVGSAIFDAIGLRIRTVLFTPGRVKAAFSQE